MGTQARGHGSGSPPHPRHRPTPRVRLYQESSSSKSSSSSRASGRSCRVAVAPLPGPAGSTAVKRVFPVDVDMVSHERAEACDIFVSHGVALSAQPAEGGVDIDGVPENDAVQNDTQRAKRVHSFPVSLEQFAAASVEYLLGERVPSFLEVAHSFDAAPVGRAVDDRQDVEGFEDAAVGGDCLGQGGGMPVALQGPDPRRTR
jgi:hypothetical protein